MQEQTGAISTATGDSPPAPRDILFAFLTQLAEAFNQDPALNEELKGDLGPINGVIGMRTDDGSVSLTVDIENAIITIHKGESGKTPGASLVFQSEDEITAFLTAKPDDGIRMFLASRVRAEGNTALFSYFSYLLSLVSWQDQLKAFKAQTREHRLENFELAKAAGKPKRNWRKERLSGRLKGEKVDPGVLWLEDPYLSRYAIEDFPRLARFLEDHHGTMPEVTAEQGKLLTDFFVENGYEKKRDGSAWHPALRAAEAFKYLMENKNPLIRENDLLAGTITPNPVCGSVNQPYTVGWLVWGELLTLKDRELDPFYISPETARTLAKYVFPYWLDKNVQQVWKKWNGYPLSAQIYDRMFCFNFWSLVSLGPGSPGIEKMVRVGLAGLREEIDQSLARLLKQEGLSPEEKKDREDSLAAMRIALDGISAYVANLAAQVEKEAEKEQNPARKEELAAMHKVLLRVPEKPARTLHEAVQVVWLALIGLGLDSMDDDIQLGRLDQTLQPYFEADMQKTPAAEREAYVRRAIEIVGCLFMRVTSHRLAAATIASWQNSGAPSTNSIVVGGVKRDGSDAVNDMTYVILKVTELLCTDDPDMDARIMVGVNSPTYIKRVAEVNYLTSGTPAVHNDEAVIRSLTQFEGWELEDARDWVPCGCVEPVITGKHLAATGDLDSNLMAPLTMALYNGYHPVAKWDLGPKTGEPEDFKSFDEFFEAFVAQFKFLYTQAFEASHQLLKVHQEVMPSPLYSVLLEGCIEKGKGMTVGGARYNSSGAAFIALSDVVDSLLSIKQMVFDEQRLSLRQLRDALDRNFEGDEALRARIMSKVPKLGSGHGEGRVMANRVTRFIADYLHAEDNGRGGHYTTGYRTNNNHTVYGRVSGASPSGRLAGKPFTSGLTPSPSASTNILDNLNDIAAIDPLTCDNSYTFNVRISFSENSTHRQNVERIANYMEAFFLNGGMQMQFNMVDADTLKDAMANPEEYPDLIVRVSGYTGYYTRMQRDLQLEVIGRTEFHI